MNVLNKLKNAFPGKLVEKKVDTVFILKPRARIYVRHSNDKLARIIMPACKNFPHGDKLEKYIRGNNIPFKETGSHPDAVIDNEHIDAVINILLGENNPLGFFSKKEYTPNDHDYEVALKQLTTPGVQIPISAVEDQIEGNMAEKGIILNPSWRKSKSQKTD